MVNDGLWFQGVFWFGKGMVKGVIVIIRRN